MASNTRFMISYAQDHYKFWDIDKVEHEKRLVYFEKIVTWGENESLVNPSLTAREMVE